MKRTAKFREAVVGAVHQNSGEMLHEQIPLRDMSDCLLAVYDEVSRRAFQRGVVRGARAGSERDDWKAAEEDLFARISVDFEESGGNLYALASLPGCAGTEIAVAVDECWLLIAGYVDSSGREDADEDFGDCAVEDFDGGSCSGERAKGPAMIRARECCGQGDDDGQRESLGMQSDERDAEQRMPILRAPRPFCVVALRAKVDPERSVAVLSNGLLAIRMGKAGLETPFRAWRKTRTRTLGFSAKDARLKAAAPFDPALRDLRLNRAGARFTKATEPARRRRYPSIPRCEISG